MSTSYARAINQAALGGQHHLVISAIPSGAAGNLIGKRLIDAGELTVAGDYFCDFDAGGAAEAYVHLKATFAVSTVTSDVYTTYKDGTTSYQAFTGDGALTTATLQTSSLTTLRGEQRARVKLTLGATPAATFSQAEWNAR